MGIRSIEFRGKQINTENQLWKYGDLLHNGYDYEYAIRDKKDSGVYEVIPETIGQYTGLTDKNGTKIFEGDIITREYDKYWGNRKVERKKQIGYVIFKEGQYKSVNAKKELVHFLGNQRLTVSKDDYVTVIGNIHDNPELLKEV